jgi:hypothetical protein
MPVGYPKLSDYGHEFFAAGARGSIVVKVFRYKPEGRGFEFR